VSEAANHCFCGSGECGTLVLRYEELRGQALGEGLGAGHGCALFLRRGMAAWMGAWSECAPRRVDAGADDGRGCGIPLPAGLRSEAAMILTGMVLNAAVG